MMELQRENYQKFIDLARSVSQSAEGEFFTFDLNGLSRIVDVSFTEGRISELTSKEGYADNPQAVEQLEAYQNQIEQAFDYMRAEVVEEDGVVVE